MKVSPTANSVTGGGAGRGLLDEVVAGLAVPWVGDERLACAVPDVAVADQLVDA